ncbi:MAG: putative carboxylesterase nap [Alphaproteobacteria bacterium MarineAlpha3_Bin7]|nr:MAG: putative carboxylesterase nap [Alphaproteobacteria bacterium MarineAlpha3_Bin7]
MLPHRFKTMGLKIDGKFVHATNGGLQPQRGQEVIILIHGAGMNRTVWQLQTRNLSHRGFNTYALDLPGHGKSDGPGIKTIEETANWINKVLETMKINKATIIGHSMGALVALDFGSRFERITKSLILIGVADSMPVHEDLLAAAKDKTNVASSMITLWGIGEKAHKGGHLQPGYWLAGANHRLLQLSAPNTLFTDLSACNNYKGGIEAAKNIKCPVKLILGDKDRMTPKKRGLALAKYLKNVSIDIIPDCGHMIMVEQPEAVFQSLQKFILFEGYK